MASFHLRSISLPSKPHPLTVCIQEQLHKLKESQPPSIGQKLASLKDLFECVDDLLQLPLSQLCHDRQSQCVEEALNGSIDLLDMCSYTRDFLSQVKRCMQELQLSLRRRKGADFGLKSELDPYMVSRKQINKMVCNFLRNLKRKERKITIACSDNMLSMLRSVEEISIQVFESILSSFYHQPLAKSKTSRWLVVSKLLQIKRVSCEGEIETNEVEKIDAEILVLKSSKDIKSVQVQNVLKGLEALESSMQEVEAELEFVYRKMLKTRVSLLNMLNH